MTDQFQQQLPAHLRFARAEEVAQAEGQLQNMFQVVTRSISETNHIPPKKLAEKYILPLLGTMMQWTALQIADVLRYTQTALAATEEHSTGVVAGIPIEEADAMLSVLDDVLKLFKRICEESPVNKGKFLDDIRVEAKKLLDEVSDVSSTIEELALEEEEDEGFIETEPVTEAPALEEPEEEESFIEDEEDKK